MYTIEKTRAFAARLMPAMKALHSTLTADKPDMAHVDWGAVTVGDQYKWLEATRAALLAADAVEKPKWSAQERATIFVALATYASHLTHYGEAVHTGLADMAEREHLPAPILEPSEVYELALRVVRTIGS